MRVLRVGGWVGACGISEGEVRQLRDQKKNLEAALLFGTQEEDLRRNVQQGEVQVRMCETGRATRAFRMDQGNESVRGC